MAVQQKLSEIGWFYHAPEKRLTHEPMAMPLASQIPGLNDFSDLPPEEPPRTLLRDTDTKYIRMAKMGGREGLLRFRENDPKPKSPVGYPRNDWFYLEDNRMDEESAGPQKPWEFRLPEYMVHDEFKPFGDDYDYQKDPENRVYWKNRNKKHPLCGDGAHVYERDGASIEQIRSVKITEDKPSGYGVRGTGKPKVKQTPKHGRRAPIKPAEEESRYPPLPQMYDHQARPAMNKLLAYGYATEWTKTRDDWYTQIGNDPTTNPFHKEEVKSAPAARNSAKKGVNVTTWNDLTNKKPVSAHSQPPKSGENKKPFKLSKFANVSSKVDNNRT